MIIITLKLKDVNKAFEDYPKAVERWMGNKPFCRRCGGLFKKNGTYKRSYLVHRKYTFFRFKGSYVNNAAKATLSFPAI